MLLHHLKPLSSGLQRSNWITNSRSNGCGPHDKQRNSANSELWKKAWFLASSLPRSAKTQTQETEHMWSWSYGYSAVRMHLSGIENVCRFVPKNTNNDACITACAERFSCLSRLKTYLRNMMTDTRLSGHWWTSIMKLAGMWRPFCMSLQRGKAKWPST